MYTDSYFAYPALEAIEMTLNYTKQPVFLYDLVYRANNSFSQVFGSEHGNFGVCHADELMHLFPIRFLNKERSEEDEEISKLFVTLWTNFATSGDPNKPEPLPFKWTPVSNSANMEYLEITLEPVMQRHLAARSRFWGTLPLWHNLGRPRFNDEL